MRVLRVTSAAAALVAFMLISNCGKKSAPTAPPPPDNPPQCEVSATQLAFGSVTMGSSAERSFTISNTGGGTLTGNATSNTSPVYAVIAGASYSLTANQHATVTVRFTPSAIAPLVGTIALSGTGCGSVACSGTGAPSGPYCQLSTTSLDFGTAVRNACDYRERTFVLTNAGTGTLAGTVTSLHPMFEVLGSPGYSLASGQRDTFTVRFSPTAYGDMLGKVTTGCDTVYVHGFGESAAGCATLSATSLDFGTVYVGQTVTKTVTLYAGGSQFDLAWVSDGDSNFDGPPPQLRVQPGDFFTLPVDFAPSTAGLHSSWFKGECMYAIGDGQYHVFGCVTVTGTAVVAAGTPTCQLSATSINFGSATAGSHVDRTLTVTNTGGGVLTGNVAPSGCSEFTAVGDPTVALGPGQSATYTIRFTPSQAGHAYTCYAFVGHPYCSMVTFTGQGQ